MVDREFEFPEGSLATVTRVELSEDKQYAAVMVSILGPAVGDIFEILSKKVYIVQQMLNRRIRMRPVPKIHFAIDEEEMRREGVEKTLGELKRKGEL